MTSYTIAQPNTQPYGPAFVPVGGIPRNLTLQQASKLASAARAKGHDVVAFNVESE